MDTDDRLALGAEVAQELDDRFLGLRIDALERFVHQIDLSVLHQSARDEDTLLLPPRQLADVSRREVVHPHLFKGLHREPALVPARAPEPAERAIAPHRHDVENGGGEVPVDAASLWHVADHTADVVVGPPFDQDPARRGGDESEDRLDKRRLTRTVRPHDRAQNALGHLHVDVPEDRGLAVGDREVFDVDRKPSWFCHSAPPGSSSNAETITSTLWVTIPM